MKEYTKRTSYDFGTLVVIFTIIVVSGLGVVPLINEADAGPIKHYPRSDGDYEVPVPAKPQPTSDGGTPDGGTR